MKRRMFFLVVLVMFLMVGCAEKADSQDTPSTSLPEGEQKEAALTGEENETPVSEETDSSAEEGKEEESLNPSEENAAPEEIATPEPTKTEDTKAQTSDSASASVTVTTPAKPNGTTAQATAQVTTPAKPQQTVSNQTQATATAQTPSKPQQTTPTTPAPQTPAEPSTQAPATTEPAQPSTPVANDPSQRQNIQSKYLGGNNDAFARSLLVHVNAIRRANGVPELVWDDTVAANAKANAMRNMQQGYLEHGGFNKKGSEACGGDYNPGVMAYDPYFLVDGLTTCHTQGIVEDPTYTKLGIGIVCYVGDYNAEYAYITIRAE